MSHRKTALKKHTLRISELYSDCEDEGDRGSENEGRDWVGGGRGAVAMKMKHQRTQTRTGEVSKTLRYRQGAREADRNMSENK